MIIRTHDESLLFITQPDHAKLAAQSIADWQVDGFAANGRRRSILLAAREHDNGWHEEDVATHVDESGAPLDFVTVPIPIKQRIWPRAVDRLGADDPYAAALVARHALSIYDQYRRDAAWSSFFDVVNAQCETMLTRCDPAARENLDADYRFVNAADRISLAFCTAWTQTLESYGRRITLNGNIVEISPDPFAGGRVPLHITARRLASRRYTSATDLRAALEHAELVVLEGQAVGAP